MCIRDRHCTAHGDFAEGIRALLIDKDKKPRWNPAVLDMATEAWVQKFFDEPWPCLLYTSRCV